MVRHEKGWCPDLALAAPTPDMSAVHMLILLEDSTSSPDTQHSQEAR